MLKVNCSRLSHLEDVFEGSRDVVKEAPILDALLNGPHSCQHYTGNQKKEKNCWKTSSDCKLGNK